MEYLKTVSRTTEKKFTNEVNEVNEVKVNCKYVPITTIHHHLNDNKLIEI